MTNIASALESFRPELETRMINFVHHTLERLVRVYGPALRGVVNSRDYNVYANSVRPVTRRVGVGSVNDPVEINEAYLAKRAAEYAEATVASWAAKIEAKLNGLNDAEVIRGQGASFTLRGTKNGRRIVIDQDMIVNCSSKGTLFNQFPARIYVDGKFMSAAKYAAL
jgi:hypothetical protein